MKFKSKELADATLHRVERNNAFIKVKDELQSMMKKSVNNHDVKKTLQLVNHLEKNNTSWDLCASF